MSTFLELLISGLVSGAIYSIYASGITLLYSTTGIYNFAFGAMAFCIDLLFFQLLVGAGLPTWLCFVLSVLVFAPLMGLALERIVFRELARASETARMVGSVGLVVALPALGFFVVKWLVDNTSLELAPLEYVNIIPGLGPVTPTTYELFGTVTISSNQIIVFAAAALSALALWIVVAKTRLGLQMRAVVDRRELAALRGADPARTSRVAWMLGTTLAGLAGVVSGPLFGLSPTIVLQFVIVSSTVVVLARFRSLPIAFVGGLLLGAVVNLIAGYARKIGPIGTLFNKVAGLSSASVYLLLFIALYFLGRQTARAAGVSSEESRTRDYLADLPQWRRVLPWAVAGGLFMVWALGLLPSGTFAAGPVEQTLVISGLGFGFVYLSFTVVTGLGGMVSLAQATFVTAGALTAGWVANQHILGGSFVMAALLGALGAVALGVIVTIPALRLGGVALALATLALAFIGETILFRFDFLNNHSSTWQLTRPSLGPIDFNDDTSFIVLLAVLLLIAVWLVGNLEQSATGRSILAVRNVSAASSAGISPTRAKLAVFAVSAGLAGLGGVLLSYGDKAANDSKYPAAAGLLWLTIAVTWGVRRRGAAIIAGLIGALFPRVIQTGLWFIPGTDAVQIPAILFGLGAIGLARNPDGIVSVVAYENYVRRKKRADAAKAAATPPEVTLPPPTGGPATPAEPEPVPTVAPPAAAATIRVGDGATSAPIAPPPEAALVLNGVHAGYGEIEVLHGIDLVVPKGAVVALVGANGAGKSTLCAAIAGSIALTGGSLLLDSEDVSALPAHRRAAAGLLLSPESRGIFPAMTVEDNLAMLLRTAQERSQVYDRFPILGERRGIPAGNLSGGEQQMLSLAPLLVRPPKVLVADEPTLGLAPLVVDALMQVFTELRADGTSLLLVEEKLRPAIDIADHLALIRLGEITWSGRAGEATEEEIAAHYLGTHEPSAAGAET